MDGPPLCFRCREPRACLVDGFCPTCVVGIKVEVERGLHRLAGYLLKWAIFEELYGPN